MKFLLSLSFALFLMACGQEAPTAKVIVVDKKMPLLEWPDSNYVNSLDSILALEPLKAPEKKDVAMALRPFSTQSLVQPTKKKDKSSKTAQTGKSGAPKNSAPAYNAETFVAKFSTALSAFQSDPSNASLYKSVEVKDGEDLVKLLKRTYGGVAANLPRFYVLSALQSVNPGVALERLSPGDKVRVPRL